MANRNNGSDFSDRLQHPEAFSDIITRDESLLDVLRHVESIAQSPEPVLVTGETGVGKELVARAVHRLSGRKGALVAVNVAGLEDNVFSDTLFGHIKGAYTGADSARMGQVEKAAAGTLFLDEIGDLSLASQVKLLRLLQEGEYLPLGSDTPQYTDCRIVTATNVDLWALQRNGAFRRDLNFRLRTHHLNIPPLRERRADLRPLTDHFLSLATVALGKEKPTPTPALLDLLASYSFPGNVRELQAMIYDAVSRHQTGPLALEVFKSHIAETSETFEDHEDEEGRAPKHIVFPSKLPTIKELVRQLVQEAMHRSGGNQTIASSMLGISRQALGKRLKNIED